MEGTAPRLLEPDFEDTGAGDKQMKVLGKFKHPVKTDAAGKSKPVEFVITKHPLNLLGIMALRQLQVNVDPLIHAMSDGTAKTNQQKKAITTPQEEAEALQKVCHELCKAFSDLFKPDIKPIYCKPQTVSLALLDHLNHAEEAEIKKLKWIPTQFNKYGTPAVPIRKTPAPGQKKANLRVCRDYSVTINHQLETHHPTPSQDDLMQRLSGSFYFTKIDLVNSYNQVKLSPESQRRLALSTYRVYSYRYA